MWTREVAWSGNSYEPYHPGIDTNPWRYKPAFPRLDHAALRYLDAFGEPGLYGGVLHRYVLLRVSSVERVATHPTML